MDLEYLILLQGIREEFGGEKLFLMVSELPKSAITAMIPAILFWCFNKQAGIFLLFNAEVGRMVNELIKGTFCVYRPWIYNENLIPEAKSMSESSIFSFPSGHAQFTTAIYGGFAFFYRKRLPRLIILIFGSIILLVAFSRNFLGVHTPQDVLVAIIYSIGLFYLAEKLFKWLGSDKERQFLFFIGAITVCAIIFVYLYYKPYPEEILNGEMVIDPIKARADAFDALGFGLSYFLGWFLEQKLINFKVKVTSKDKLWRIIIGLAVLGVIAAIIYPVMKVLFSFEVYKFFKAFLPFFAILFVIPLIFTQVEKKIKG